MEEIIFSTLRVATPMIFAAMAGLLCERSGVVNIALEGLLLVGAFVAAAAGFTFHSAWLGLLAGTLAASAVGALFAWLTINRRGDQVVVGMAINLLCLGLVPFLSKVFFDSTGSTPALSLSDRFTFEPTLMVLILVVSIYYFLQETQLGLWISFAGESPESLTAAGISVNQVRWFSVILGCFWAGAGGASLSVYLASAYSPMMSGGRGFMALAALILGGWRPFPVLLATLFFGLTDALQIRMQGVPVFGMTLPAQMVQVLPYLVTLVVLAGFLGKSRAPKALGQPHSK